jgi:hypothetical protein
MLVTLPNLISELQHALLPFKVLRTRGRAPSPYFSHVFNLDSHLSPLKNLGCVKVTSLQNIKTHNLTISRFSFESFENLCYFDDVVHAIIYKIL